MEDNNISSPNKGLSNNTSYFNQPEGTYPYALNAVNRNTTGNYQNRSNEQGNKTVAFIPMGWTVIGEKYISDSRTVLMLVKNDESASEIGIFTGKEDRYDTHVNDELSDEKLNFKLRHQIDIQYRLRRGCEDVIYFTDNFNDPRIYNFNTPEDFQYPDGKWNIDKFKLIKTYSDIPSFDQITVENGGTLPPGSYNFSIQYLDENLNATEFIKTTEPIIIYNDNYSKDFSEIRGSTNEVTDTREFEDTNKAIKIELSNLDPDYLFYRIAIIKSNNGSGQINEVTYSERISTEQTTFIYTGEEDFTEGTVEEVLQFTQPIRTVEHLEQSEKRLLFGNTKGKQINFCKLQKYASKIQADVVLTTVTLDDIKQVNNPKRGEVTVEKRGYMPGEIYPFGIVWVFDDGYTTPAFHIPGKNPSLADDHTFIQAANIRPMSKDNTLESTIYTDNESCEDYWGVDSEGDSLMGQNVRHHRFPLRSELDLSLYYDESVTSEYPNTNPQTVRTDIRLKVTGVLDPDLPNLDGTYKIRSTFTNLSTDVIVDFTDYNPVTGIEFVIAPQSFGEANNLYGNFLTASVLELDGTPVPMVSFTYEVLETETIAGSTITETKSVKKSQILGIKFSNIELPTFDIPEDEKIIGYYIVRMDRKESDKTILDNGIFHPTTVEKNYIALGHLNPSLEESRISKSVFGLIHPEHKFFNREYFPDEYIVEGQYKIQQSLFSDNITNDVMAGSSYDPEIAANREKDYDGYSLHTVSRDTSIFFEKKQTVETLENDDTYYLDALDYNTRQIDNTVKKVYNVSSDNKTGVVQFKTEQDLDTIPYVVMKRSLSNPYSDFRTGKYYVENLNMATGTTVEIFNGDSYISSMRYTNTMFYDIRLRNRDTKSGFWNTVLGVLATIGGVALAATGNAVAGVSLAGFGLSQLASGIKKNTISKTYQEEYEAGLRDAVDDNITSAFFGGNPPDDELQWFTDHYTNVWIESGVNMNWRMGNTVGLTDFLNSPQVVYPTAFLLNSYALDKLTDVDNENASGRLYKGYANAEIYDINLDYVRRNREKVYFHLPIEYDCCSDCIETFPQRVRYSEQSFQEELVDHYRVFLPNNYTDIQGESGVITDLFTLNNRIFVHTEEALWELPKNYQERVTGDIISFIGTGSFFEIPPQKIIDDETGSSAGTRHKWGSTKTPYGMIFISEGQRKVYLYNGSKLKAISDGGFHSFFNNNLEIQQDKKYLLETGSEYIYANNPANLYGTGFISVYDALNERILITKKDDVIDYEFSEGEEFCLNNDVITTFPNKDQIIADEAANGWEFTGIVNCKLQFEMLSYLTEIEEEIIDIPNDTDLIFHLDTSGSFDDNARAQIKNVINTWVNEYRVENPDWLGNVYYNEAPQPDTEYWVKILRYIKTGFGMVNTVGETVLPSEISNNIVTVSFVNEAGLRYHDLYNDPNITAEFLADRNDFIALYNDHIGNGGTFNALLYPLVFNFGEGATSAYLYTLQFLNHALRAIEGGVLSTEYIANLNTQPNPFVIDWNEFIGTLQANSISDPYPLGLKNFGWDIRWNRGWNGVDDIIDGPTLEADLDQYLQGLQEVNQVVTQIPQIDTKEIDGVTQDLNIIKNSWTLSYDFNSWVSFHSYLPNTYFSEADEFYSLVYGNHNIYRHNIENFYQNFYGVRYPFIIEVVSNNSVTKTKVWNHIKFNTEAYSYNEEFESQVEERFVTFNKVILYNTRQCSGELNLIVKDDTQDDYLLDQITNQALDSAIVDKNEKDWYINDLRDYIIDTSMPMFKKDTASIQEQYYTDKVVNTDAIDFNKDWTQLEPFRDKYLVIRYIFDTFDNINLVFNFSIENETTSFR